MSKVAITGNASGTGVFTVASTNSNVDRVLTLPDESGTVDTLQRSGNVIQVVNFQTGALATGTTVIPWDNTIPQITEGNEYMTLSITPTNINNVLLIEAVLRGSPNAASQLTAALFQGAIVDALSVGTASVTVGGYVATTLVKYRMLAGTTSATTFRIRAGMQSAGTLTFNGNGGVARMLGTLHSSITITEYTA